MTSVFNIVFKKYDSNGDGKFSKAEFGQICYSLGHFLEPDELNTAFTLIDSDGNGEIDREEFLQFWREDDRFARLRLDESQSAKIHQMGDYFRFFDKDGNGTLDRSEFEQMTKHMAQGGYNLKFLNFSFDSLDKDGNGKVTFNEYIKQMIDLGALDASDGTRPVHG